VLPVLPKLTYLMLCRTIQLLALLVRGDAAKDLEILVLRLSGTQIRSWPLSSQSTVHGLGMARRRHPTAQTLHMLAKLAYLTLRGLVHEYRRAA
jgi:hypothetical protein